LEAYSSSFKTQVLQPLFLGFMVCHTPCFHGSFSVGMVLLSHSQVMKHKLHVTVFNIVRFIVLNCEND
jgi:hypothetical protein